jgi:ergothioneine biosynthesis glutamate--cysteine ligase EgtA
MPVPRRVLTEADVRRFVEERCFPAGRGRIGAELEWFVSGDASHEAVAAAAGSGPFPGGSSLTFEPGGQVELSSPTGPTVGATCTALAGDAAELERRLAPLGAGLLAAGVHPERSPKRVVRLPRYDAMESFWANGGEHDRGAGLAMMCTTAAVQVSVDASIERDGAVRTPSGPSRDDRWRLAHALSPVLSASFANSPLARGRVTGWRSWRLGIWEGLDRTRTAPALRTGRAVDDWTAYLLDANVMLLHAGTRCEPVGYGFPFGRWMVEGHRFGWPDEEDLAYHLSTVFPPVRAKGWLELRCMDAVPDPWWAVAVAVTAALLDDEEAADGASRVTGRASWCWCEAPRWSLSYEALGEAARQCFALASDALPRMGAAPGLVRLVESYREQFVDRGRCPADDTLDDLTRTGGDAPAAPAWAP